ncbi:MAG: hypothetical protein ACHQK9_20860 [Reyranellales bacterium]
MGGLYRRRNLGVRGSEEAGDLFGQRLIGGKACKLALPQIEITPGQTIEIGGSIVVFGGHGRTIAYRRIELLSQSQTRLVALRHRR